MKNKIVGVVGGLILKKNKVLICQRAENYDHPLKWEFPGGKILVDENVEKALIREINEELMIDIFEYKFLCDYIFEYKKLNKKVHLYFYLITKFNKDLMNTVHKQVKWIEIKELSNYDFLDGDHEIIQKIINNDIKIY
ncbi:(deoxy)nucleoside triphosphate pyrophosphohydrolase [Alphaproteobacteria bacterium]|jgi:8-oxo-dGTP diphosphatase|nr:(deoxy)nucleoside triphosphate pyrophosphohydrolase [Alphaproteobacteria bacterium]